MERYLARGWRDLGPPTPLALEVPSPEALLAGLEVPGWFLEQARRLHRAASVLERVACVGMLARYGSALAARPAAVFAALVAGTQQSVGERAQQWARNLAMEQLDEIERQAIDLADCLYDDLYLGGFDRRGWKAARHRRDELASVAWVLRAAHRAGLDTALDAVDAEALTRLDQAASVDPTDKALWALSWLEPTAWWSAIGRAL